MRLGLLLSAVLALAPAIAAAQPGVSAPIASPAVTHHVIPFDGGRLAYTATAGETVLDDPSGKPAATIFSVSYLRDGEAAARPVVFFFNGGPGSSSSQLHLDAFGPMRPAGSRDAGDAPAPAAGVVPNPETLLGAADLVFIDPVGTGFSRVLPGGAGQPYWTAEGDARSVLDFIRGWLRDHGRAGSPVFVCGESYGGVRLALILRDGGDLKLAGAIFLSPMLDISASSEARGNDLFPILALPTMSAIAAYHHKTVGHGSLEAAFDEAERFAEHDYAPALLAGDRLSPAERQRVATAVAERIGLPAATVLRDDLRVTVQDFVTGLLADKGQRVGRTDGRYVGDAAALAKNSPPFDDPAISFGGGEGEVIGRYIEEDLKFAANRPYTPLAMNVNMAWNYAIAGVPHTYQTVAPFIGAAARADPKLKVFVAVGYYDLALPMAGTDYALGQAGLPPGRLTERRYASGHSMYQRPETLKQLTGDLQAFIRDASR